MTPALPVLSGADVCKILEVHGFSFVSQKGSHAKYRHPDGRIVIVPMHSQLAKGTLMSIIRQSGLPKEVFVKTLR